MAKNRKPSKKLPKTENPNPQTLQEKPQSWSVVRNLFTCKHLHDQIQILQQKQPEIDNNKKTTKYKKLKCSGSLCNNTKVTQRPEPSPSPEEHRKKRSIRAPSVTENSDSSSSSAPFKRIPFRRLSGCYECRMVVDPIAGMARDPSLRATICSCPVCGEIFMKAETLELHQSVKHAVSELGPEDTSKNIVEIIFQSSWLKKQSPVCKIDRILKVNNTQKTITKFEEYRDSIKAKAANLPKKHPRCVADGNELLRFHCATLSCSIGLDGSSNLCNSISSCGICGIVKNGFRQSGGKGILTTATSGKAHDGVTVSDGGEEKRAMIVCRVIAGRVKKGNPPPEPEEYDSVAGAAGVYSNLDELFVFNHRAILPCFIVIYRGF